MSEHGSPGTGVGAVVFTDLVGFTEYTAVRGDREALGLLALQEELVRSLLPAGARVVKELGDGLLLWMPEAAAAVRSCIDLGIEFDRAAADDRMPLWVRMGAHWGAPTRRGDDLVGHVVNVASRVVDVAGPGELLCTEALLSAAGAMRGVGSEPLGPVVMKGLPDPVALFRVERLDEPVPSAPHRR